jgi:hypothetical protein
MSQAKHQDRPNIQFPRIRAQEGTAMAYVIEYLKHHPIEPKFLLKEFLYHSFFVRAFNSLIQPKRASNQKDQLVQEGWKSIWYHWGTIESICAACDIPPQDVVHRLSSAPQQVSSPVHNDPFADFKISDFASYVGDANADEPEHEAGATTGELSDSDRERMNDISGLFGA